MEGSFVIDGEIYYDKNNSYSFLGG